MSNRAYQLLGQRDLLQRHLVHAGGGGASRDSGGEECGSLHDCNGMWLMGIWCWDGRTRGGGERGDDRASLPLVPGNRAPATGARALLPSAGTSSELEQKSGCWFAVLLAGNAIHIDTVVISTLNILSICDKRRTKCPPQYRYLGTYKHIDTMNWTAVSTTRKLMTTSKRRLSLQMS